jgi:hypothetical protein
MGFEVLYLDTLGAAHCRTELPSEVTHSNRWIARDEGLLWLPGDFIIATWDLVRLELRWAIYMVISPISLLISHSLIPTVSLCVCFQNDVLYLHLYLNSLTSVLNGITIDDGCFYS